LTPGWSARFQLGRSASWPGSPPTCRTHPQPRKYWWSGSTPGKYVQEGHWLVPARIELHTQMCRVTLDFTRAVITSSVLRIDADMVHGKLFIVSPPGIVISTDGLALTYSKLKLHSRDAAADPRLRIELAGSLVHSKVIERRP
jgi:hypothetical protein